MDLIFACFGIFAKTVYSHHSLHTRFIIFAQIRIQIYDLMQKNTCCNEYLLQSEYSLKIFSYWRIFPAKYSFRNKYSQNFKLISHSTEYSLANIRFKYSLANIRLQIFAFKRIFACKYSLRIASNSVVRIGFPYPLTLQGKLLPPPPPPGVQGGRHTHLGEGWARTLEYMDVPHSL